MLTCTARSSGLEAAPLPRLKYSRPPSLFEISRTCNRPLGTGAKLCRMFAVSLSLLSTSRTHRSAPGRPAGVSTVTLTFSRFLEHCQGLGGGPPIRPELKLPWLMEFVCCASAGDSWTTTAGQATLPIIKTATHIISAFIVFMASVGKCVSFNPPSGSGPRKDRWLRQKHFPVGRLRFPLPLGHTAGQQPGLSLSRQLFGSFRAKKSFALGNDQHHKLIPLPASGPGPP